VATVDALPDAPGVDNGANSLTNLEFMSAAHDVAGRLAEIGIGRGDKVATRVSSGTLDLARSPQEVQPTSAGANDAHSVDDYVCTSQASFSGTELQMTVYYRSLVESFRFNV
jgi:uncharacterized UPF0146 family protein